MSRPSVPARDLPPWAALPEPPALEALPDLAVADPRDDPVKRYYLARLAGGVPRAFRLVAPLIDDEARRLVQDVERAFCALSDEERSAAVDHPIVHFAWLKLMESTRDRRPDDLAAAVRDIGRLFFIPCARAGVLDGLRLPVRARAGVIRFPGHQVEIRLRDDADGFGVISVVDGQVVVSGSGWRGQIPLDHLLGPAGNSDAGRAAVRSRRCIPASEIDIDCADPLIAELFASINAKPRSPGEPVPDLSVLPEVSDETVDSFGRALALLDEFQPALGAELRSYTKLVVPFRSAHISTFTENALMGAVFMSEAYRPFSSPLYTMEHLVHEHSHLRLALVMEIDPLFRVAEDARFSSPWRKDARPLLGLVQGAFVFARIARLLNIAAKSTGDPAYAARRAQVVDELADAVRTLTTAAGVEHTALGSSLIAQYQEELNAAAMG